jgi:hypothetical protein
MALAGTRLAWDCLSFTSEAVALMQIGVESSRAVENQRVFVVSGDEITRAVLQFMLHDEYETHEFADLARGLRQVGAMEAGCDPARDRPRRGVRCSP